MNIDELYFKAINRKPLNLEEACFLYENAPLNELGGIADRLRRDAVADPEVVTWQIDRNLNTTNVCVSGCKFCNFYCTIQQEDKAYITQLDEYREKIEDTLSQGGDQLLLQGGLHPKLGVKYYEELFVSLKKIHPKIRLHALGAPEIVHISRVSKLSYETVLERLVVAGLDSLPGAGAEILNDRVRRIISPNKPKTAQWCEVMRIAHKMNLPTSATMMYGHVETIRERMEHLLTIRDIQSENIEGNHGFIAFIPWPYMGRGTQLEAMGVSSYFSPLEYLRLIAMSRILLYNIRNIQASWLTIGIPTAQLALHYGANDLGSIMLEERVVSSAGANNWLDAEGMQKTIRAAGFLPQLRNQLYEKRCEPHRQEENFEN